MAKGNVRAAVDRLPPRPGVYLFKDAKGRVLYIGKAKRLDHRVRGYLAEPSALHPRTARLVRQAADLDFIVTASEAEALVLEATLVREHRPHFNVRLKDDKTFPWVKLSVQEEVPRLSITRRLQDDGARYFGPYTDAMALRKTLRVLRRVFPLRTCANFEHYRRADRPCLNYHVRRCVGPCYSRAGVRPERYRALVDGMALFLAGRHERLAEHLRSEMQTAAEAREYERAARARDRLALLERLGDTQRMAGPGEHEADAVGVARQGDDACVAILQARGGRVVGRVTRYLRGVRGRSPRAILEEFLIQHYLRQEVRPREIWLAEPPRGSAVLEEALRSEGRGPRIRAVQRGRARRLVQLAQENAEVALESRLARRGDRQAQYDPGLHELMRTLGLERPPVRIVCFDVSNLGPSDAVASVTVSEGGQPRRSDYRRMRMRHVGPDDFAMMREAVGRYFTRVAGGEIPEPDLVVVDGGVGQVESARAALEETGFATLPLVGLAKREERIVLPSHEELALPRRSPALRTLMRLRDEAHRFAVTYHRKLRTRRTVRSALDEVRGVGPARRRALLAAFGSVREIARKSVDELVEKAAVPRAVAERVHAALSADGGAGEGRGDGAAAS